MSNGWGVHLAGIPGQAITGNIGTTNARGVSFSGAGSISGGTTSTDYASIWPYSEQYPWGAAPGVVSVMSDSDDDTALGTGARGVVLEGVDSELRPLVEVVLLDGTTPVLTAGSFTRLHMMTVVDSGSGARNAGTITGTVSGDILSVIRPSVSRQEQATWTIPSTWGNGAILGQTTIFVGEPQNTVVDFTLQIRPLGSNTWIQALSSSVHSQAPLIVGSETPFVFSPGMDLEFVATRSTRNNAAVFAAAEFLQL